MIEHDEFQKLRLGHFFPSDRVVELENWEFDNRLWIGDAIQFSEWLRPAYRPNKTEYISLDFAGLPRSETDVVVSTLGMEIRAGMSFEEIAEIFGIPENRSSFTDDRVTLNYKINAAEPYRLSFTLLHDGGLTCFGMMLIGP